MHAHADPAADLVDLTCAGLPAGSRVLDVGAGYGPRLADLIARGYRAHGVDASYAAALDGSRVAPVAVADVRHLPWDDATFDAALATFPLQHLPADQAGRAVGELARVLRPGGRLVLAGADASLDALVTGAGFTVTASSTAPVGAATARTVRVATR
jgi:demethylmenaquinone methyltransferase/2-methoxy-6-polyprenyl-1,4-benzoquinol methylase